MRKAAGTRLGHQRRQPQRRHPHLDGRASPPVAKRPALGRRFRDREVGRRHAHRADHAPQDRVDQARRRHAGSDHSTITMHLTRRENLLTLTTIQEDPHYLTEPHVVSRVWEWNPRAGNGDRPQCNTRQRDPVDRGHGIVPHQIPGKNPEEDYMVRTFNLPKEAAMGYAETLYPEYSQEDQGHLRAAGRVR